MPPLPLPESRWADLDGPVHWVDHGGPSDGPLLVCVHGLGGSHLNWLGMAPLLTRTCRVVALDLAGFGLTRGEGRPTSVHGNRRLLHRFVTEVAGGPAILVGNSMGGLVSALTAASHPQDVAGVVLIDPALPPGLASPPDPLTAALFAAYFTPGVGRAVIAKRRRTWSPEELAAQTMRFCCADPSRVPEELFRAHVGLVRRREYYAEMEAEFVLATRSLLWTLARRRQYRAMLRGLAGPVLLVHGERDRLVPVAAARATARENPGWRYEEIAGVGHIPQVEVPDLTARLVLDWLDAEGVPAVERAREASVAARRAPDARSA